MTRPRVFYAIAYAYGRSVINHGTRPDHVYQFATVAERDRWIADGPPDITASGDREAATSRHPLVRKALRAAELGLDWPQAV